MEVPLSADSGSDVSIVPRSLFLGLTHVSTALRHPLSVEVVGGATLVYRERAILDVQEHTAAGPVSIKDIDCLVPDEEDQFILGKDVLSSLGIMLEP